MVDRYRSFWGVEERRLADSLGLDEREVVTLASIVEEEARVPEERPVIAGVYLNRIQLGWLLQADPTVQYALGEPKERLLYSDIDAVADNPYNTYTHPGLPPGPIASPGEASPDSSKDSSYDYSYGQAEAPAIAPGLRVRHPVFGPGSILAVAGTGAGQKLRIRFDRAGVKTILVRYANLELG